MLSIIHFQYMIEQELKHLIQHRLTLLYNFLRLLWKGHV